MWLGMTEQLSVLVRCDGDKDVGMGHVVRCLALADELKEKYNCCVIFAIRQGKPGITMISEKGYSIIIINQDSDASLSEEEFLERAVTESACKAIIMDFRVPVSLEYLRSLHQRGIILVDIDDPDDKRLAADLVFYPPVPQVAKMDWTGFKGQLFSGWEWVILRREFAEYKVTSKEAGNSPNILITMGGSDPAGLTIKAMQALDSFEEDFNTTVILGPGFFMEQDLKTFLHSCKRSFNILRNVHNMPAIMAETDLAVASFGVTAYELACIGVPSLYLCLTDDHAESCEAFVKAGIAFSVGNYKKVMIEELARTTQWLLWDVNYRYVMRYNACSFMDGKGSQRIVKKIVDTIRWN